MNTLALLSIHQPWPPTTTAHGAQHRDCLGLDVGHRMCGEGHHVLAAGTSCWNSTTRMWTHQYIVQSNVTTVMISMFWFRFRCRVIMDGKRSTKDTTVWLKVSVLLLDAWVIDGHGMCKCWRVARHNNFSTLLFQIFSISWLETITRLWPFHTLSPSISPGYLTPPLASNTSSWLFWERKERVFRAAKDHRSSCGWRWALIVSNTAVLSKQQRCSSYRKGVACPKAPLTVQGIEKW